MDELIRVVRPLLELAYFIAGILLCVGVGFSYSQLRILKQDIRTRNIRSAREKALQACEEYFAKFVPLANSYVQKTDQDVNLKSYDGKIGNFTSSSIPIDFKEKSIARYKTLYWVECMNKLEYIAAYFCTEVADEQAAYPILGRSFVKNVEQNYDVLSLSRKEPTSPYYPCIVELYGIWRNRINLEMAELEKNQAAERLKELAPNKSIPTIGV